MDPGSAAGTDGMRLSDTEGSDAFGAGTGVGCVDAMRQGEQAEEAARRGSRNP